MIQYSFRLNFQLHIFLIVSQAIPSIPETFHQISKLFDMKPTGPKYTKKPNYFPCLPGIIYTVTHVIKPQQLVQILLTDSQLQNPLELSLIVGVQCLWIAWITLAQRFTFSQPKAKHGMRKLDKYHLSKVQALDKMALKLFSCFGTL